MKVATFEFRTVDIKIENLVLVDKSTAFPLKIIDFGMAIPMFARDEVMIPFMMLPFIWFKNYRSAIPFVSFEQG